jgi:hypothetical protein
MRKFVAMGLIAMLAAFMAFAALSCGGQKPAEETTTETPMENAMPDTGMGGMGTDTMMSDTGAAH